MCAVGVGVGVQFWIEYCVLKENGGRVSHNRHWHTGAGAGT